MAIRESLLNKTVNIFRITANTKNEIGEVSVGQRVTVSTGVKCRITNSEINAVGKDKAMEQPYGTSLSEKHFGFFKIGTDIKVGDKVVNANNSTQIYYVDEVIKEPGGSTTSHIETRMTSVTHEEAS